MNYVTGSDVVKMTAFSRERFHKVTDGEINCERVGFTVDSARNLGITVMDVNAGEKIPEAMSCAVCFEGHAKKTL